MPDKIICLLLSCLSVLPYVFTPYKPPADLCNALPDYGTVERDPSRACGIQTDVRPCGGVPTLYVNGAPLPAAAYMTYLTPYNRYDAFAHAGYNLFSMPVLFAGRWISAASGLTPFSKGIFDDRDKPDFSAFDADVRKILDACPDALIFPRVNVSMPLWWIEAHPDCLDGTGERESFYADVWREDAAQMLRSLIAHIRASSYGAHIAGYQLAAGNTEEWFHFDLNGGYSACAQQGFESFMHTYAPGSPAALPDLSPLKKSGTYHRVKPLAQFLEYANMRIADCIACLAHTVKQETGGNVVVGAFYGYALEVSSPLHGTHALHLLLDNADIDFFCSPNSYLGIRDPDTDWSEMYAADSVRLHGKLCMQECDIRTHLTQPLPECAPEYDPDGLLRAPIWNGLADKRDSVAQMRKSFCRQLVKGNGFWWFDMWGGWYDDPDLMREMQTYRQICAQSLAAGDRKSPAQFAVFVDETAFRHMTAHGLRNTIPGQRAQLGWMGAPFDMYDIHDFETVAARYKAVLFASCVKTPALRAAVAQCRAQNIPFLMPSAFKHTFSAAELRAFCRANGVHVYCETDDIVYVNAQYIAVHAVSGGEKTIHLPSAQTLRPLLGTPPVRILGSDAVLTLEKGETVLLERV